MGNLISIAHAVFNPPPWRRLHRPTRISIVGLDLTSKLEILRYIASKDFEHPDIVIEIPSIGLILEILTCGPLTITALDLGGSKPTKWTRDVDWVRANTDGMIVLVDCRDHERWPELVWELKQHGLGSEELRGCPLLAVGEDSGIEGEIPLEDVRRGIREAENEHGSELEVSERLFALEWMEDALNSQSIQAED
ncbi:hypothetical protein CONPUDRAFT_73670 [Coniophora puteana RWD-64-598 SS2]|uniref:P-loop containing nucleoside triphosphate hydrolase protein n=1 Tax=Coniophora puteana (strain RWD-64-598) TaxID=741705 RepID=A0A5M3MPD8_CONPW|nr:uncharacterized protein CONPUDRAFT_73670 [Coniophora puteana RWD-64-598 SS2]EIW80575.1 hypothetical protein CONPUDRAFT_73670 [Coniophora puteana RWD-64-598 SS2]